MKGKMNAVAEQKETIDQPQAVETAREFVRPGVNILETTDGYVLEAEMPGVSKDGLNIRVEGNILTLVGRRQVAPEANLLYRESGPYDFRRVFELDPSVETAKITARIEQGILSITLPKAEKAKPQRIVVN
jgi:HSP20 family protein